jgi:hypothetical protein
MTTTRLARGVQLAGLELRHGIAHPLAVRRGEVVDGAHDPRKPGARPPELAGLVDAGRDQHRVVPRPDLLEGNVGPDLAVEDERTPPSANLRL